MKATVVPPNEVSEATNVAPPPAAIQVLAPDKKTELLAVPDPSRAVGTVPVN